MIGVFTVTVDCVGCGACLATCPPRVIRPAPSGAWRAGHPPLLVGDGCTGCGECAEVCPVDACVEVAPVAICEDVA